MSRGPPAVPQSHPDAAKDPGCDGCTTCDAGAHRKQAQATFALYQLLDQAQWEALRELQD